MSDASRNRWRARAEGRAAGTITDCRYCGHKIRWVEAPSGRTFPVDPDPHADGTIFVSPSGAGGEPQFATRQPLHRRHRCPDSHVRRLDQEDE